MIEHGELPKLGVRWRLRSRMEAVELNDGFVRLWFLGRKCFCCLRFARCVLIFSQRRQTLRERAMRRGRIRRETHGFLRGSQRLVRMLQPNLERTDFDLR